MHWAAPFPTPPRMEVKGHFPCSKSKEGTSRTCYVFTRLLEICRRMTDSLLGKNLKTKSWLKWPQKEGGWGRGGVLH